MLKLRFPIDGRTDIAESFEVNEPDRVVSRRKTFAEMLLVLVYMLLKIAGDANVQRSTRGALHHVDVAAAIRVQMGQFLGAERRRTKGGSTPLAMTLVKNQDTGDTLGNL
jgi:hypothetical protein